MSPRDKFCCNRDCLKNSPFCLYSYKFLFPCSFLARNPCAFGGLAASEKALLLHSVAGCRVRPIGPGPTASKPAAERAACNLKASATSALLFRFNLMNKKLYTFSCYCEVYWSNQIDCVFLLCGSSCKEGKCRKKLDSVS